MTNIFLNPEYFRLSLNMLKLIEIEMSRLIHVCLSVFLACLIMYQVILKLLWWNILCKHMYTLKHNFNSKNIWDLAYNVQFRHILYYYLSLLRSSILRPYKFWETRQDLYINQRSDIPFRLNDIEFKEIGYTNKKNILQTIHLCLILLFL